ncbi:MAG: prepilin-type N-terminal cleavage/methylation domain-containing protein [Proteobacteria bacterium]|nr:prepilin-type N-terminal cleavage/methylation domain-containing protein [Pseudomonadota bacterium]
MKTFKTRQRQPGFSLIELMISVVIGVLAMMFVMRTTIDFESARRSSIGGSDSMQNGVVALFSMENDAAQSGWGLNDGLLLGCNARFFDSQGYSQTPGINSNTGGGIALQLLPVSVVFNGVNPDVISFMSGTSDSGTGSAGLSVTANQGATALTIDQPPFGFKFRDVVVIAPTTRPPAGACVVPYPAGSCCTIAQVSSIKLPNPPIDTTNVLNIVNDGTTSTRFNQGGGLIAAFAGTSLSKVFNLGDGNSLLFHTWDVNNGVLRLRATELAGASAAPASAVTGIVSIKALYGFDTRLGAAFTPDLGMRIGRWSAGMLDADGDGVVGSLGDYQRMTALRLAVVARSSESEKPDAGGTTCKLSLDAAGSPVLTVQPTVFASQEPAAIATVPIQVNVAVAGDPVDWTCYRYRVSETIVPLRNLGWKP